MVAVDSTTTGTMVGYHGPHYAIQSFHHSESSLAFSFNDSSDSFAWSDFDEATEPTHTAKSSPSRAVMRMEAEDAIFQFEAEEDEPEIVREPEMEERTATASSLFLEFSSSWPMTKNQANKKAPTVAAAAAKKSSKHNRSTPKPKRHSIGCKPKKTATKVRFAPTLEVRTHSIVLGDHPWCEDGLAVELGWDYEVSRDICQPQKTTKLREPPRFRLLADHNSIDINKKTKKVVQRSQQERKRLLLEVGGCSETELDIRSFQAKILLDLEIRREEERRREQRRRRREKSRIRPHRTAPRESNSNVTNNDPNPCVGHTSSLYAAMA